MYVLNAAEMRAADAHAINDLKIPSIQLMENAATSVVQVITQRFPHPIPTLIVAGKGNNGGDGLATARLLKAHGWPVSVLLTGKASELKDDPAENWKKAVAAGVSCKEVSDLSLLSVELEQCELIVDALFGTGLSKPLDGIYSKIVQFVNQTGKRVVSIDVPSGVSSDSGDLFGPAIQADVTVALASLKYCHVLSPACRMSGEIYVVDIGIPVNATTVILHRQDVERILPHRKPDAHKGTFGHALIIAGSRGKSGAAYMAGKAALRAGAGLSTILVPASVQPVVAGLGPEIMTEIADGAADHFSEDAVNGALNVLLGKSAVAIGPGLGTASGSDIFLRTLLDKIQTAVLIDADGLNLLSRDVSILKKRKPLSTILTPHPGEMGRLLGKQTSEVQKDRIAAAKELSAQTGAIVVLKGFRTILANPAGNVCINLTGGQALASAGTGDVLTGIITGFLAQGLAPWHAAIAGVYIHGFVANLFESEFPQQALNAMDILDYWNRAVHLVRTDQHLEDEYLKIHIRI